MSETPFDARVRRRDGLVVIDLEGDINAAAQSGLDAAFARASEEADATVIVLSFADVRYINSTGIALVVSLLAKARVTGHRVVAFGLSDHYRQIFEITRLSDFLTIFTDEVSALTATATSA